MTVFAPTRGGAFSTLAEFQTAVERAHAAIGRTPGAGYELDDESAAKLRWLQRDGRDFRAVTPELESKMSSAFVQGLRLTMHGAPVDRPWTDACVAYRDHVAWRLLHSGGDVKVRPVTAETARRKGNALVGYATGDLQRAVATARVRTTRGR